MYADKARRTAGLSSLAGSRHSLALGLTECQRPPRFGPGTLELSVPTRAATARSGQSGPRDGGPSPHPPHAREDLCERESEVTTATKVAIKPLEDRIVVQPSDAEQTTASGLVIPDTAKEKPQEGTVLAVGPGRFEDGARVPLDVAVGDTVIYSKYGGTEVKYDGEEYLVLSARDVLAVIEK